MPVSSLLDRIRDDLAEVWESRAAPDDVIEYDGSLTLMSVEDQNGNESRETVLSLYVALGCPEHGSRAATTTHMMIPVAAFHEGKTEMIANDVWDRLVSSRLVYTLDLDEDEDAEP